MKMIQTDSSIEVEPNFLFCQVDGWYWCLRL
jgi:hypothetical protein